MSKKQRAPYTPPKIGMDEQPGRFSPLKLIANLAQALRTLGLDIPILDVRLEDGDLVIVLYGGRIEKFPLDYDLVVRIDQTGPGDPDDAPLRLALSALGRDKHSPPGWMPGLPSQSPEPVKTSEVALSTALPASEVSQQEYHPLEDYLLTADDILNGNWETPKRRSKRRSADNQLKTSEVSKTSEV